MVSAEENKSLVRRYFEEHHDGREHAILEEIMTPDLLEGTRQVTQMLLTAFPDYRLTIEEQVVEADKVATIWTGSGTSKGEASRPLTPSLAQQPERPAYPLEKEDASSS
jgi:predicted ester cyclase